MDKNILPQWMIKTLGILLIIFMVLVIINQLSSPPPSPQVMRVSGEGKVSAIPDLATVTIGVVSQGATPIEVKNVNNQKINQVIAYIKQQGIEPKDITTTGFYASPKYNYVNGQNNIIGYQADQTITIKIRNIDKSQQVLETILDGAINNGANEIQGVNFSFTDTDKLKQTARKIAIENAKKKANELARAADLTLGKAVNIIEPGNDSIHPMPYAAVNFSARSKSIAPNIEPGDQDVVETVVVLFEVH